MPRTPPSSRIVELVPAALPIASGGTAPTTEFWAAGKDIEMPTPATISGAISVAVAIPASATSAIQPKPSPAAAARRP